MPPYYRHYVTNKGMSLPVKIPVTYSIIFRKNELPVLGNDANAILSPIISHFLSKNLQSPLINFSYSAILE